MNGENTHPTTQSEAVGQQQDCSHDWTEDRMDIFAASLLGAFTGSAGTPYARMQAAVRQVIRTSFHDMPAPCCHENAPHELPQREQP